MQHRQSAARAKGLALVSLFSGAGGLDSGLQEAGFNRVCAVECDPACCTTLRLNDPTIPLIDGDIRDVAPGDITKLAGREIDLLAGGPPCQSFSVAGNGTGTDDWRGCLLLDMLLLAKELRPRNILIENVEGLCTAKTDSGPLLPQIAGMLRRAGYKTDVALYNMADHGVPQLRRRVLIIAYRHGELPPMPPAYAKDGKGGLPPWRTLRQALCGVKARNWPRLNDDILELVRQVPPGGCWANLPTEALRRKALGGEPRSNGGQRGVLRRLAWDRPSPTVMTAPERLMTMMVHPDENRVLSVEECAAVQTIPATYAFAGDMRARFKMIGNAVPPVFAECVGRHVLQLFV